MSKHLGNILEPIPLMERHGADALRWFMLASGSPWSSRRVGHKVLEEIASKVIRTYWSIASFQSLYARANSWAPGVGRLNAPCSTGGRCPRRAGWPSRSTPRWRTSTPRGPAGRSATTSTTCRTGTSAARAAGSGTATRLRSSTLHECLDVLTRLLAPFVPFVTEQVWGALFAQQDGSPDSVHLASWPALDPRGGRRRRSARRWRSCGGSWSWAGRRGRTRR